MQGGAWEQSCGFSSSHSSLTQELSDPGVLDILAAQSLPGSLSFSERSHVTHKPSHLINSDPWLKQGRFWGKIV